MIKKNFQTKITSLWTTFLLGLLFHTQLGLMPLFHSLQVADSQAQNLNEIAPILWLMLGFFVFPLFAIIATAFWDSQRYRKFHLVFTLIYSVLNTAHLIADLMVQPIAWYQIALMFILLIIGLLLNLVSYQWVREQHSSRKWVKSAIS
ncbi:MAG: hypothetical protein WCD18_20745 [Thermosynechococcaceae cyanobacterium]